MASHPVFPTGEARHDPAGPTPPRRARSIRRTSSMEMAWPEGQGGPVALSGKARDIFTGSAGAPPVILDSVSLHVIVGPDRLIRSIESDPPFPGLQQLVGENSISGFRARARAVGEPLARSGSPLFLLIDDIAGTSLISGWAWTRWPETRRQQESFNSERRVNMEGICTGFSPGSAALLQDGHQQSATLVPPLVDADDPDGWHALDQDEGVQMRRARRIDVWREGDRLRIDATFQDSANSPQGRVAVHEYVIAGTASSDGSMIEAVEADPRILPYPECAGAAHNVDRMTDTPAAELRDQVLLRLRGVLGCTHLNDALRALAELPRLAALLETSAR